MEQVHDESLRGAMVPPETRYAQVGDAHIAYQTLGSGPPIALIADWFGHLDAMWEWAPYAHALRRLAAFGRLIVFDKRGVGLSDQLPDVALPGIEEWMQDISAVLDAVGEPAASLIGVGAGAAMCIAFAAAHPGRVERLVLVNAYARLLRADDYPPGYPAQLRDRVLATRYSDGDQAKVLRGGDDPAFDRWWRRFQRQSVSPNTAAAMRRMMFDVDVRGDLAAITCPTLVLHRRDDEWIRPDHGRYLADHIEGATFTLLPGEEDLFFHGDADGLIDEIEHFVTGSRGLTSRNRALATVMFTDIVDSTRIATRHGDGRWRVLLDDHDAIVHRHIEHGRGWLVKSTGDGVLALFPGPSDALTCAVSLSEELSSIGLPVRTGLHVGEIELRDDDVGGIAVNIAARVTSAAAADQILVSRTVCDAVAGSRFRFDSCGLHALKGVDEPWELFSLCT